ncbi:hypothetical protein KEM54_006087 [Ascosphaera aggregata]|nr:hypothetical protein KEM54_006087 [Ascosphaera aggregata]
MDPRFQAIRCRQGAEPTIECWDDDGDLQCIDDLQFRIAPKAHPRANSIVGPLGQSAQKDSMFGHRSLHSDSDVGDLDDDSAFLLDESDQPFSQVVLSAFQSGRLPGLLNASALALRGATTMKQSENHKKDIIQTDDWTDGLDLSSIVGKLELRMPPAVPFPDSLSSPRKSPLSWLHDVSSSEIASRGEPLVSPHKVAIHAVASEPSAITKEDDTVKLSHLPLNPQSTSSTSNTPVDSPATCLAAHPPDPAKQDDHQEHSKIANDATSKLNQKSAKHDEDRISDDPDSEWAEGSLGVRHGGTQSEQARRSSAVYSPSISSRLTVESEDDALYGLVVPNDTSGFVEALQQRLDSERHDQPSSSSSFSSPLSSPEVNKAPGHQSSSSCADDFFADFEIDGKNAVFASRKASLDESVKQVQQPVSSPNRTLAPSPVLNPKTTTTTSGLATRIPRPTVHHDRSHSAHNLSANAPHPLTEGSSFSRFNRSRSQLASYASGPSTSSIPVPVTSASSQQAELGRNPARGLKSHEGTNPRSRISTQGLSSRKSVSTVRPQGFNPNAAPQKQGRVTRAASITRSKTPVEREPAASKSATLRRNVPPHLSTGTARRQSHHHHATMRATARTQRRTNLGSLDITGDSCSFSKFRGAGVSTEQKVKGSTPQSGLDDLKRPTTEPSRSKEFGDGTELDAFDDLPTSASAESRYVKNPSKYSTQRSLRLKMSTQTTLSKSSRAVESAPSSPFKSGFKPRFAWDTKSSRNAREQKRDAMAVRERDRGLASSSAQPTATPSKSLPRHNCSPTPSAGQPKTPNNSKPHLIRPMGSGVHDMKYVKGMRYNPALYRWEGNENAISDFDDELSPVAPRVAPALIANVGTMTGVQIVNGMVFDPQRMCWVKLARSQNGTEAVTIPPEEDDDPFFDLSDLEDKPRGSIWKRNSSTPRGAAFTDDADNNDRSGDESDDWPITEEFDVGPEFIRRQRAEEDKWRRRLRKWLRDDKNSHDDNWRWAIRDIVNDDALQNFQGNPHSENAQS